MSIRIRSRQGKLSIVIDASGEASSPAATEELCRRVLAVIRRAWPNDPVDLHRPYLRIGIFLRLAGRYTEAEPYWVREAQWFLHRKSSPNSVKRHDAYRDAAEFYEEWGRYDKAAFWYEKMSRIEVSPGEGDVGLARMLHRLRRDREAEQACRNVLEIWQRTHPDRQAGLKERDTLCEAVVGDTLVVWADILAARGEVSEAASRFDEGWPMAVAHRSDRHIRLGEAKLVHARILRAQGNREGAEAAQRCGEAIAANPERDYEWWREY